MFQQTTDPEDARGRHQGTAEEKAKTKAEGTLNLISSAPNHELTDTAKVTEYLIDDNEYPEGGIKAWLTVLGAWCGMVPSMGLLNTHGILQAWVSENDLKELPESQIGWIFSCFTFFLYFGGVLIGPVFDSRDPLLLIVPGSVGCVLTSIFMSFSTEFYQYFLSFGVLGGISASLLLNPSLSAIGHWFNRRRALATGIACTAGGIGGVAFPLVIIYLAPQIGFAWSLRVIALICAVLLCVSCLTLRKRLPHNKPDGMAIIDIRALGELHFGLATLSVLLIEFAIFIPYTYVVSYAAASGLSPHRARMLSVILNASAVPGRALPGYVADRFGAFNTMAVTSLACTLSIWAIWLTAADSATQITAFTVLFGFWSGSAISLAPVCLSRVCRIEDYGKRLGTCYFVTAFAALIGVPIAGAIVDGNGGDYKGLIVFGGALYTASFIAFVVARGVIAGWRMTTF